MCRMPLGVYDIQLDLHDEDVCYINGDTAQHLWSLCYPLICPQRYN